ncbi:hypothetical protein ACUXV3_08240 [Roseobacteraceae bacterium NS-SX3]
MRRALAALGLVLLALLAQPGGAEVPPEPGLMWNRTGLPAVFPLLVKSPEGQDYVLTLLDAQTGEEALAAYVKGGAFFRVLVPPGRYRLRFAPQDGGGAAELPEPLTFRIQGYARKGGHIVDLTGGELRTVPVAVCQWAAAAPRGLVFPEFETDWGEVSREDRWSAPWGMRLRSWRERPEGAEVFDDLSPYYSGPLRFELRSRLCR